MNAKILLIEDDASVAGSLKKELETEGYDTVTASRGDDGLTRARKESFNLVITDLKMPGLSGLELIEQLHAAKPKLPIILMTAFGTTETAIEATKLGAFDYLLKPFEMAHLLELAGKALACNRYMSAPLLMGKANSAEPAIVGNSRAMQTLYKEIGLAAASPVTALLRGETGTGKELVAKAIHQHSNRARHPFIAVSCTAIPEALLESELFGHERGAFTGAQARRIGRFEQARLGTIFLDEIGDLSLSTQVKLLRVLQEKCIQRVGGNHRIAMDVRVLTATHRDLEAAMEAKEFREDLFYRLSALTIRLPPLRERLEDIPALVKYFIQRSALEIGVGTPSIHREAVDFLQAQPWPGNVRELENVIRHALLLARDHPVSLTHVQQVCARTRRPLPYESHVAPHYLAEMLLKAQHGEIADVRTRVIEDIERELFAQAISLAAGNQAKAARWLGVTRTTLREKLAHFGLRPPARRPAKRTDGPPPSNPQFLVTITPTLSVPQPPFNSPANP